MQGAIEQFRINVERARNLSTIYKAITAQVTGALDLSDILRTALVMTVSALDHYVHEIVRVGMLEAYGGQRPQTPAFRRFQVSLAGALQGLGAPGDSDWLQSEIRTHHGYQSFQSPENIADGVRLISEVQLWNDVAARLGLDVKDVRDRLRLIVNRRNQIAHEADLDPSFPGRRWPVSETLVDGAIDFIEDLAEAIQVVVR